MDDLQKTRRVNFEIRNFSSLLDRSLSNRFPSAAAMRGCAALAGTVSNQEETRCLSVVSFYPSNSAPGRQMHRTTRILLSSSKSVLMVASCH